MQIYETYAYYTCLHNDFADIYTLEIKLFLNRF